MLSSLPRYVSENPDNMPAIRLFEGDLKFLLSWLEKTDSKVDSFGIQLDTIMTQISSMQTQLSAMIKVRSTMSMVQQKQTASHVDDQLVTYGNSHASSTPQPRQSTSTMSSSATENEDYVGQDDTPFIEAGRKRNKKRRRVRSNGTEQQGPQQDDQQPQQTQQSTVKPSYAALTRSGKPLIVGKLTSTASSNTATKILAAKPMIQGIKKSVYCIDNVHNSVSVADLCEFVENLSVRVVSCFETKPRKRRREPDVNDHKAFRLCIASQDNERLLDSTIWPEFVSVSEWFFKSSTQQTSGSVVNNANASIRGDNSHVNVSNDDMDSTIIVNNGGY